MLTEFPVDSSDKLVDDSTKVLILFDILSARHGNLNQDDFANPLRVVGQEDFQSVKFLRYALDVIETIHTDNQFDAFELFLQDLNPLLDLLLLQTLGELVGVNANRKSTNRDDLAFKFYSIGCGSQVQYSGATAEEVSCIVIGMEANEITVQNA
jgi:hypothetical protein